MEAIEYETHYEELISCINKSIVDNFKLFMDHYEQDRKHDSHQLTSRKFSVALGDYTPALIRELVVCLSSTPHARIPRITIKSLILYPGVGSPVVTRLLVKLAHSCSDLGCVLCVESMMSSHMLHGVRSANKQLATAGEHTFQIHSSALHQRSIPVEMSDLIDPNKEITSTLFGLDSFNLIRYPSDEAKLRCLIHQFVFTALLGMRHSSEGGYVSVSPALRDTEIAQFKSERLTSNAFNFYVSGDIAKYTVFIGEAMSAQAPKSVWSVLPLEAQCTK